MKISKKYFPSLFTLMSTKAFKTHFKKRPEFFEGIESVINDTVATGLDNIEYLSRPVIDALDGKVETVIKLLSLRNEVQSTTKCFIYKAIALNEKPIYVTDFVTFDRQDDKTVFHVFGYWNGEGPKDGLLLSYYLNGYFSHSDQSDMWRIGDYSYAHPCESMLKDGNHNQFILDRIQLAVQFQVFLQYAELQVKLLRPHHKDMNGVLCRYENKLPFNVKIIDSTWFTTLVKSDAFKVRGHFRLQPFGHGIKQKKLIWINEFQKEGYTREAKILSEHPTTAGTL